MGITLHQYWNLLREFTICGFKLRDQGSVLGFLWTLLHPMLMLAVLYMLFVKKIGSDIPHFGIYLLIGITHWSFFATATTKTVNSLLMRRELVVNIKFPREILVIGDVGTVLISFMLELLVLLVLMRCENFLLSIAGQPLEEPLQIRAVWLLLPVVIGLQSLFIVGVGFFLASLNVFIGDIERIWTIVLRIGFFLVPIFYSIEMVSDGVQRKILLANPLTQIMGFSRSVLIDGVLPSLESIGYTVLVALVLFGTGLFVFKKLDPHYAERL